MKIKKIRADRLSKKVWNLFSRIVRDVNMLQKIAYSKPWTLDFYDFDLWLRRKAIFYLTGIKGIELIPELVNNGCEV